MSAEQVRPAPDRRMLVLRIAAVFFAVGLSVTIYLFRDQIPHLQTLGYPGVFLVTLLANATIILPMPGVFFTSLMGAVLNPIGVAFAAGAGAALGELSGYLAGFGGQAVVERTATFNRIEGWVKRYGHWAILVLAVIPNPFFDVAGMIAGMLKIPLWRFLVFCWIGSTIKMLAFAFGGAGLVQIFER